MRVVVRRGARPTTNYCCFGGGGWLPRRSRWPLLVLLVVAIAMVTVGSWLLPMPSDDDVLVADKENCDERVQRLQTTVKQLRDQIEELQQQELEQQQQQQEQQQQELQPPSSAAETKPNGGVAEPSSDTYLGCFADSFEDRDLQKFISLFRATPQRCQDVCFANSYKYAGLQDGLECWCGNSYGRLGEAHACQKPCEGDPDQLCGGPLANSVYLAVESTEQRERPEEDQDGSWKPSSVRCTGSPALDRTCEFEDIYYDQSSKQFVFFLTPLSTTHIVGEVFRDGVLFRQLLFMSTVPYFAPFSMRVTAEIPQDWSVRRAMHMSGRTFALHRFLPSNVMHTIHDDLLGLFHTMQQYAPPPSGGGTGVGNSTYPYDLQSRILVMDDHRPFGYFELLQLMSELPVESHVDFLPDSVVQFDRLVVGSSKHTTWYQYGFDRMQGPIPNKFVDGSIVRDFGSFIRQRYRDVLPAADVPNDTAPGIVILSRTLNRRIVNEDSLKVNLERHFRMPVYILRLEELRLVQAIWMLSTSKMAIGMHGSIFILALFMPKNSVLLEMFPYGILDSNYAPYRTLARLPGVDLVYLSWMNKHKENTIGYPNRHRLEGGIGHLSAEQQREIVETTVIPTHLCCEDPQWLYHIYQDTVVDVGEVVDLLDDAAAPSR